MAIWTWTIFLTVDLDLLSIRREGSFGASQALVWLQLMNVTCSLVGGLTPPRERLRCKNWYIPVPLSKELVNCCDNNPCTSSVSRLEIGRSWTLQQMRLQLFSNIIAISPLPTNKYSTSFRSYLIQAQPSHINAVHHRTRTICRLRSPRTTSIQFMLLNQVS